MSVPPIPAALVDMVGRGVSVHVASRDARMRPSVMRGLGLDLDLAAGRITVFVSREQAGQLVLDLSANGHVAVVVSEPLSHRAMQLKATRATLRNAVAADEAVLARYLASMERAVQSVGHAPRMARAMLAHRIEDLVAVSFTPDQAFDQTPGPKAGAALGGQP
ncbi:hypothetical protein GCM10027034_34170 [Ramlibacter solisilvae]|uniref:Pyridoxamine 5'-phosphate oxidase putative domain-containing protein n=1 Tax=Ramlibacter tataouinensis TaxID=94132 RepID=A0A127JSN2_9BURK|nr:hypothetical protein [Ramlibacter tataouinensis]AMO22915.1 hypothetical protein UC35_08455 [Ramlibacter tataouinensis]